MTKRGRKLGGEESYQASGRYGIKLLHKYKARNTTQQLLFDSLQRNDIVFGLGAAGSGKTFTAVFCGLKALAEGTYDKIIITRPLLETGGERIGHLPGDYWEKVDPFMNPIYDAIDYFIGPEMREELIDLGIIVISNLGFMRGRTFNNSFMILDEAQNVEASMLKMYLTRMGFKTVAVVLGDDRQCDLSKNKLSCLQDLDRFRDVETMDIIRFTLSDVVRAPIVQKVLECYEN